MILFAHNRYRTTGGEERVVEDLLGVVRSELGEQAELLTRESSGLASARAALGLARGGLDPGEVGATVGRLRARVLHAHNLQPTLGWRALASAREAGARVVLHLHQYRLVCAVGVCFTAGQECTRCHGRNTLPGVLRNCRDSRAEALAYGFSLALWQRRLVEQADAIVVPSHFARERLRELGAPLPWERVHVLAPPVPVHGPAPGNAPARAPGQAPARAPGQAPARAPGQAPAPARGQAPDPAPGRASGGYALVVSRLSPEKGVDVAIEACRIAGLPLRIAGDGPQLRVLQERARDQDVLFLGRVSDEELTRLRAGAAIALVPSLAAETFGMAAAEAMACGLPVAGSRVGALGELLDAGALVAPGDVGALAAAAARLAGDRAAGERGRARIAELCAPAVVARSLAAIYDGQA